MPEPFAVFQYYRYGIRHALVAQKLKHVALVFDFGGGTFDTCVIETTAAGDISKSGRNSKPLAARSIPVGGFLINRLIAENLLFKGVDRSVDKNLIRKVLKSYAHLKGIDDEALAQPKPEYAVFMQNFRRVLQSVEQAKISVCSGVTNWRLDANLAGCPACSVEVPLFPFQSESPFAPTRLEASDIRSLYETQVWKLQLLPAIRDTLNRAQLELSGKPISIVLLSGGSSNIRWLKVLIERDLHDLLNGAEILELSENFQEIVSKGLAVECARRFYNPGEGDFRAVTYNRLCLVLNPNENGLELKRYVPDTADIEGIECDNGVLLPSSTSLKGLFERPLRWKVRLNKAPSRFLDYYFLRSSFDPDEMIARHNIIDSRVPTPRNTSFGSSIGVELIVREDGTAEPSFVYGKGSKNAKTGEAVRGKPFYMDMTSASEESGGDTYLGFDFGTCTSSLCYVDANDIRVYADRAQDRTWVSLSALIDMLPYLAAHPLARFLSETSSDQAERWGREALEAMLSFVSYVAFAEHCNVASVRGSLFKGFRQRSAGPLWKLFRDCAASTGSKWTIGRDLVPLSKAPLCSEIDLAVSTTAQSKHGKRAADIDYPRILEQLGNIIVKCMNGKVFGYFEDARRKPFSMAAFQGVFRNAKGPSAPFVDIFEYEGREDFPSEFMYLFDIESGRGLSLFPLMARIISPDQRFRDPEVFLYDIVRGSGSRIAFKAVQEREELVADAENNLPEIFAEISRFISEDPRIEIVEKVTLRRRNVQ